MRTIAFYSYKGGVGRTLVVANVARYLAQFGLSVAVLDLDLEAPGLHYKFALAGEDVAHRQGVADYLAYYLEHGAAPAEFASYYTKISPPRGGTPITLIPAGDAPSGAYWEALSKIDWHYLLYGPEAPGIALFENLRARIEREVEPDYLLIDSRTGMTEMGGIATSLLADVVVTLTLPTREHLEGVRSVLRSIKKTRQANGDGPIGLEVALSRLNRVTPDDEKRLTRNVIDYLNEPARDPTETLELSEALVLHADPSLQEREYLLIGAEASGDEEPVLLGDYLKLFGRFIPLESLAPRVQMLVKQTMDNLLDDPTATERALRTLTRYTGHPDALRALIRFYRVRQDGRRMLGAAARLWEITGKDDLDLVWTAVREGFEVTWRYVSEDLPIDFIAGVWAAEGGNDLDVGLKLAQTLDNFGREDEAVTVAARMFALSPSSEVVAEAVIRHSISAGQYDEAASFAREHAGDFAYDPDYLTLWGTATAELGAQAEAVAFLEDDRVDLEALRENSPSTLFRILRAAGREAEGSQLMNIALEDAVERRDYSTLISLAEEFAKRSPGGQRHFETVLQQRLPDVADELLFDIRRSVRGWRAGPRGIAQR